MIKVKSLVMAAAVTSAALTIPFSGSNYKTADAAGSYDMNVSIDLSGDRKEISPYIYGINQYTASQKDVTVNAVRQGGNRMTAYNWENNASNAGSDWLHSSDNNLSKSEDPADCVQKFSEECAKYGKSYKLATVQLAGYVAADKNGAVSEAEAAPSDRWNKVILTKNTVFADEPDLTDGVVYMDEYVNYIVKKLGDSTTANGIQGYSLDNEPALWSHTHSRMHPEPVGIKELSDKSIEMARNIKKIDPNAEVFGPALYGYTAYDHLADDDNSDEWETIKAANGYNWYIDSYLDDMKKASDETGTRLLDVLDIHYYSESARVGAEDRVQSVRTLYEKGFAENSWIGQWCQQNIPILPTIQKSIDKYYPGTKIAISEYNFGGGDDVSGTIAQAEALGCYADQGVYFATLWGGESYILAGINLYTNYDGNGGSFGDTLVPTSTDDVSLASSYASINGNDTGFVTAMLTNKSMTDSENAVISLENSDTDYKAAAIYAIYGDSEEIRLIDIIDDVDGNKVNVTLPEFSAAMVVITDDVSDFDDLEIYDPNKVTKTTVTFDDPSSLVNKNGFIEIPIEDPEHLKEITFTANVTSSAGSMWGSAGCAVCVNAVDNNGEGFWTSKSYTISIGNGSKTTVKFDGTFSKDDEEIPARIADGKIELQQWWQSSEKQEEGIDDVITVDYTKIEVVYEKEAETIVISGDVNNDGTTSVADLVMYHKWLLGSGNIKNWKAADVNVDGVCDGFDLIFLKNMVLNS